MIESLNVPNEQQRLVVVGYFDMRTTFGKLYIGLEVIKYWDRQTNSQTESNNVASFCGHGRWLLAYCDVNEVRHSDRQVDKNGESKKDIHGEGEKEIKIRN